LLLLVLLRPLVLRVPVLEVFPEGTVPAGAAPGGGVEVPLPVSGLSLIQWMGMKLDTFDGIRTPVEAADWLTYVEDKMDVFEIVFGDRVLFGTQLLKGRLKFGGEACMQLTRLHRVT
jgi:hypothetical protein